VPLPLLPLPSLFVVIDRGKTRYIFQRGQDVEREEEKRR